MSANAKFFLVVFVYFLTVQLCNSQCDTDIGIPATRDRRENKARLKIVDYNAEWLYTYDIDGRNTKCKEWDYLKQVCKTSDFPIWSRVSKIDDEIKLKAESDAHLTYTREYMNILDADIFVLEEICDCQTLEKVRKKLTKADEYRSYFIKNKKKQQLGIITRIDPIPDISNKAKFDLLGDQNGNGRPKGFRTEFMIGASGKLVLYAAHLIAGPRAWAEREAEATSMKLKIDADVGQPETYVLLTGDFNTKPGHIVRHTEDILLPKEWINQYKQGAQQGNIRGAKPTDGDDCIVIELLIDGRLTNVEIKTIQYEHRSEQRKQPPKTFFQLDEIVKGNFVNVNGAIDYIRLLCGNKFLTITRNTHKAKGWKIHMEIENALLVNDGESGLKVTYPIQKPGATDCDADSHIDAMTAISKARKPVTKIIKSVSDLDNLVTDLDQLQHLFDAGNVNKMIGGFDALENTLNSLETLHDETFVQLNKLNGQNAAFQYSHKSCAQVDNPELHIFDYFYASNNLKLVIDGTMQYLHADLAVNEKVCNGYSDHTPIAVIFKTEGDILGSSDYSPPKRDNRFYDDYANNYLYAWNNVVIVILSILMFCIFMVAAFVCGSFYGCLAAKAEVRKGVDICNL